MCLSDERRSDVRKISTKRKVKSGEINSAAIDRLVSEVKAEN